MEQRPRTQCAHVVRRNVGIARHHSHLFGWNVEGLAYDLRHPGVGALAHVYRADVEGHTAIGADVDHRHRCGGRNCSLKRDGETATAPRRPGAAIEGCAPIQPFTQPIQDLLQRSVPEDRAARVRAAVPQQVQASERDRIELERPRDHVGMALVRPGELRDAKSTQRARRNHIRVERVGIDGDILDIVGTRRYKARLVRDAGADVGVGAAVPEHLALTGQDAPAAVDTCFDPERAGVLRDLVELLLHRQRDLDRPPREQRERGHQRLQLDVELGTIAPTDEWHPDADLVLRPAEQSRDLGAHERRTLRAGVDRDARITRIGDRCKRLER